MKHRAGRKVVFMGLAVMAALPVAACAQGVGTVDSESMLSYGSPRGSQKPAIDVIQEAPEMRIDGVSSMSATLFNNLTGLLDNLIPGADQCRDQGKDWRLKLLSPQAPKAGNNDNPKAIPANPVGLSLHLKF